MRTPALGVTLQYWYTTLYTEARTAQTPTTATPSRFSVLLMEFHVSPTARCRSMAKCAGLFRVPVVEKTTTLDTARSTAMVVQMIGNAIGGGIQLGRRRSSIASFSPSTFGLDAFNGEKTRDLSALNPNHAPTSAFWYVRSSGDLEIPTLSHMENQTITLNCTAVQRKYRQMAPPSTTMPASGDSEDVTTGSISSYVGVGEAGSGSTLPDMRFLAASRMESSLASSCLDAAIRGSRARSAGDLIALLTVLSSTGSAAGVGVEIGADATVAGEDPSAPVSMVRSARESIPA
mmetsp:Transcript_626/g.2471  ORF Transcript_626/g.2471 Transcript_626/m.2471 type:complete len:290 (+) Transcript_626:257-1126(+)